MQSLASLHSRLRPPHSSHPAVSHAAAHTGQHPASISHALNIAWQDAQPATLAQLLHDELQPLHPNSILRPHKRNLTLLATHSPQLLIEEPLLAAAAGVPLTLRPPHALTPLAELLTRQLNLPNITTTYWPSSTTTANTLAPYQHITLYGQPASHQAILPLLSPHHHLRAHTAGVSIAILTSPPTDTTLQHLAEATAISNQLGCFSPRLCISLTPLPPERLHQLLNLLNLFPLPPTPPSLYPAISELQALTHWQTGSLHLTHTSPSTPSSHIYYLPSPASPPPLSPGFHHLPIIYLPQAQQLPELLRPYLNHLSTIGHDLHPSPPPDFLSDLPAHRIVPIPCMQRPSLHRSHDGASRVRRWFREQSVR